MRMGSFRSLVSTALLLSVPGGYSLRAQDRDWENPAVFERGQVPPHASWIPFATVEQAEAGDNSASPYWLSLNGTWKFHWSALPEESPADFQRPDFPDQRWTPVEVPLPWQMQGFDYPLFRNIAHPFKSAPPEVPSDFNPVGCYRKSFFLPPGWEGREVLLRFEGVHSASWVWVNGEEAGYNEGGMEPAEYNITRLVRPGENLVAVRVLRYSDGTYLEDQDMWRLSGIFRDVWLAAVPRLHIRDFQVITDLDGSYRNAVLSLRLEIANQAGQPLEGRVRIRLRELQGGRETGPVLWTETTPDLSVGAGEVLPALLSQQLPGIRTWSAEKPELYLLTMEMLGPDSRPTQVLRSRIGFREVEIRNQQVLINGQPVKFNGVNSHMQHPETGRTIDPASARQDLVLMKQFNVNLVRTSHYPPPAHYLDLADELGVYVIDEAGDEAHATEQLSEDPAWREAYLDRGRQMVLRDRNHPSVIIWSAGNESGSGENICALIAEGMRLDPTRPGWMYGGNNDYTGNDPKAFNPTRCETIVGPRYPTPQVLEERVAREPLASDARPSFMDEYISVAGNGLGGLDEYWDLIWRYPRLTGGAIWDWASPGIREPVKTTPDASSNQVAAVLTGRPRLVMGRFGNAVSLSGHDDFMELYRDPVLDFQGSRMTIDFWVFPRRWDGHGWLVNKGEEAYGLVQAAADTLLFYVGPEEQARVQAAVPAGWEYRWHRLTGVYDGLKIRLYIDGELTAQRPWNGRIGQSRFPVNLGRKADLIGQEHAGQLCNVVFDRLRIFPVALQEDELASLSEEVLKLAAVNLEFDSAPEAGTYFSLGIGARSYGLIWPDRRPQPELWQLKKSAQPLKIEAVDAAAGVLRFTNRFSFTDLKDLDVRWSLWSDGVMAASGPLSVKLGPGGTAEVKVPLPAVASDPLEDRRLLVQLLLAEDQPWASKGHEIAWEQFPIPAPRSGGKPRRQVEKTSGAGLGVVEDEKRLRIEGPDFSYVLEKDLGRLVSIRFRGRELLVSGPEADLFRAPVANEFERSWGEPRMEEEWTRFGLDQLVTELAEVSWRQPSRSEVEVVVRAVLLSSRAETQFQSAYTYRFRGDGSVQILHRLEPEGPMPPWLPKVGTRLTVDPLLGRLTWYGRGPFENYPDRKSGAKIGLYSEVVKELFEPYLIPQDYGNRSDVRWATLTSEDGFGIFMAGDQLLNLAARTFETDRLFRAEYPFQLVEGKGIEVSLDLAVSGVGCTAVKTLLPYQVQPKVYEYRLMLAPFAVAETSAKELVRRNSSW